VKDAAALFTEGLRVAGEDPGLRARMLLGLATLALRSDELDRAEQLLDEALPLAEAVGDRVLAGRLINNKGIVRLAHRRPHEALLDFRRALELRQGLGYMQGEVVNLHNIGDAWLRVGNLAHAWASFERSRDQARESGYERGVVMNEVFLAYLRGLRGEEVVPELEKISAAARRLGDPETALTGRLFAARLLVRKGAPGAERLLPALREEAVALGLVGWVREMMDDGALSPA
jgi:tetratricopeptide (TPR) repeat protein